MTPAFFFRKYHKWLALIVGLQAVIWGVSGLYMTAVHIDFIHGDHLVKTPRATELSKFTIKALDPEFLASFDKLSKISLVTLQQKPVYLIRTQQSELKIDATNLKLLAPLTEAQIREIANSVYAGEHQIHKVELLDQYPAELGGKKQPIWLVEYDDWLDSSLYFLPETGQLRSKRSNLWRTFDFLWMLHIMDYENREEINNNLLTLASSLGILMVASGLGLLFFSFNKKRNSPL